MSNSTDQDFDGEAQNMKSRLPWAATAARTALAAAVCALPLAAHASFLPPELMDTAAFYLAWFVIIFVPIGGIVLFWLVHILPEKIAHKRHHPQRDAIQVLCLLSLVFGGLLWPIAWLWAFTKPVGYRMAYGTEKHEDYFHERREKLQDSQLPQEEVDHLRNELDAMAAKGALPPKLKALRDDLAALASEPADANAARGSA
jgi:CBS domain containing-hemolysin-like protein